MKKKNIKKLPVVLGSIAALTACGTTYTTVKAEQNVKHMNRLVKIGLEEISRVYNLTPIDAGDFNEIKIYGIMKFNVKQYDVEDFGNLSVMTMNMGIMQMASIVLTPYEKDAPMLSMDFMYILGNRKAYTEYFNLTADASAAEYTEFLGSLSTLSDKYYSLEDIEIKPAWYDDLMTVSLHKNAKHKDDNTIQELFRDSLSLYVNAAQKLEPLSDSEKAEKRKIIQEYADNLITKGGVSTDVFKNELGKEKTKEFFDNVFFGTNRA